MDMRTPCQVLLGLLLAGVALSVLALAADNVSYVNNHHASPVDIHYTRWNQTAQAQYSYWVKMDYLPSRFSMGTMDAMLVACIVCTIVGAGVAVGSWMMRGTKSLGTSFSSKEQPKRSLPFLPTALVLTTITFLLSLAVSIYVWYSFMQWPNAFVESLPVPPHTEGAASVAPAIYQSSFDFTPEVWNCVLSGYVIDPAQSQRLQGLCRESAAANYLMIPVLLLSAALLSCLIWTWRNARLAAASDAANVGGKEIEEVSVRGEE